MSDCPNAEMRDRLPDFIHGELSAITRAEVAAHAAGCAACTAELQLLAALRASLRVAPPIDVARIVRALPPTPSRVRSAGSLRRPVWTRFDWRVAAAVVAVAAGAGGSAIVLSRGESQGEAAAPGLARVGRPADAAVQRVAAAILSIDADLGDATAGELEELLEELESFDGLPAGEPEPVLPPANGEGSE